MHHNRISDATPVAALTSLRILNLSSNRVMAVPQLSTLTCLAELNLRRNCITSLHAGASVANGISMFEADGDCTGEAPANADDVTSSSEPQMEGPSGPGPLGGSARGASGNLSSSQGPPGLPPCLQRLFVSHNKVTAIADVPALRALTQLRELALDANPLMNATHEIVRCQFMSPFGVLV